MLALSPLRYFSTKKPVRSSAVHTMVRNTENRRTGISTSADTTVTLRKTVNVAHPHYSRSQQLQPLSQVMTNNCTNTGCDKRRHVHSRALVRINHPPGFKLRTVNTTTYIMPTFLLNWSQNNYFESSIRNGASFGASPFTQRARCIPKATLPERLA